MNEFPDVPDLHAEPDESIRNRNISQRSNRKGFAWGGLVTVVIAVLLAALVSVSVVLVGKDPIIALFGGTPDSQKPDPTKMAIEEVRGMVKLLADDMDALKLKQSELQEAINSGNFATQKTTQRLENLERFSSGLEQKIDQQKKIQQQEAAKKVVKAAPKPPPIIPVVLVSIRNISGTSYVSLRDGLDDSDLLMPGDSWRGWTLITADPMTKTAIFTVSGKQQELRL